MIYLKEANLEDALEEYAMISQMPADLASQMVQKKNGARIVREDELNYYVRINK